MSVRPLRRPVLLALMLAAACNAGGGGDITGGDPAGGADGGGGGGGVSDECQQVEPIQVATGDPADLLLVVDKSGSMEDPLETGQDKWPVMRDALTTVVQQYENGIRFGLMLYPEGDSCAAGSVRAQLSMQNAGSITGQLGSTYPEGGTPTHTTLASAGAYYAGVTSPGDRYVLLATDGEPNCAPGDDEAPTVTESIQAIDGLRGDGIMTFVLGFGGTINNYPATLQAMAEAGGTGDYFAANSPDELATALDTIAGEVGLPSCSFRLDRTPGGGASELVVYQDDEEIGRDESHQSGWDYEAGNNTLTFYGAACDAILGGQTDNVRIQFGGCDEVE